MQYCCWLRAASSVFVSVRLQQYGAISQKCQQCSVNIQLRGDLDLNTLSVSVRVSV